MDHFALKDGVLHAENVPLPQIAKEVGTPVYVYSRATLERHARVFREALDEVPDKLIAFAVKSNPNLAVLKVLQNQGYGADVVSVGEMRRALAAGIAPDMIVFSGVGKTRRELTVVAISWTATSGASGVAALGHKSGNHTMKNHIVIKPNIRQIDRAVSVIG